MSIVCIQQAQLIFPAQHPADGGIDQLLRDLTRFHGGDDKRDLGAVVGGDDHVVAGENRQHCHAAVGGIGFHRVHGQIVGEDHAVKAQLLTENAMDLRGEGGGEVGIHACDDIVADENGRFSLALGDAGEKGLEILVCKLLIGALIQPTKLKPSGAVAVGRLIASPAKPARPETLAPEKSTVTAVLAAKLI